MHELLYSHKENSTNWTFI